MKAGVVVAYTMYARVAAACAAAAAAAAAARDRTATCAAAAGASACLEEVWAEEGRKIGQLRRHDGASRFSARAALLVAQGAEGSLDEEARSRRADEGDREGVQGGEEGGRQRGKRGASQDLEARAAAAPAVLLGTRAAGARVSRVVGNVLVEEEGPVAGNLDERVGVVAPPVSLVARVLLRGCERAPGDGERREWSGCDPCAGVPILPPTPPTRRAAGGRGQQGMRAVAPPQQRPQGLGKGVRADLAAGVATRGRAPLFIGQRR